MIAEPIQPTPQRWGSVLGAGLAVYVVFGFAGLFGGGLLTLGLLSLLIGPEAAMDLGKDLDGYEQWPAAVRALYSFDGLALCGALVGVPLGLFLLWRMTSSPDKPAGEALGLKWPTGWQTLAWGSLILFVHYVCASLADRYGVSEDSDGKLQEIFGIPMFVPLVVAVAVLWPIFDELFFRGFLLEGLRQSQLGEVKAILLTSFLWATMNDTSLGFWGALLVGLALAYARLRTGSTSLTIAARLFFSLAWVVSMAW
jgi:membrane protease YdiL (CAAX protease family)